MHVHLYRISKSDGAPDVGQLLKKISGLPLSNRLRKVGFHEIRLEDAIAPTAKQPYWLLDFCKMRNEGPGKAGKNKQTESIPLQQGERFSEETAALYDAKSGCIVLQYNHYGPRSGVISDYLSSFLDKDLSYSLLLQLDPSAQARLKKKTQFTRLEYKVAPAKLSPEWKKNNVAMLKAMKAQQNTYGGDWLSVKVSLERGDPGSLSIKDKIKGLLGLANEHEDAVTHLVVAGRDAIGNNIDPVDLLAEKLQKTYKGLPLDNGLRVSPTDRWAKLEESFSGWKGAGII